MKFGSSWKPNSICDYGLVSLTYLDGPTIENLYLKEIDNNIKFYWLIPITKKEADYKKKMGIDSLEQKFENNNFNYLDEFRKSIV